MKTVRSFAVLVAVTIISATAIFAQAPYTPRLQQVFTGLSRPILIRNAGDGSGRLFIVQQGGIIKVAQPGSAVTTDFINLSSKITIPGSSGDERGLLGMAFHPNFASNGKFYTNYTRTGDGATVIAEYTLVSGNPNQGNIASERILLTIPQPFSNHNGGMIEFGGDGYMYIGMGDGGSGNDPGNRAQNRSLLLGKILRIDVNIPSGSSVPYLIPPTNPYASGAGTARCDGGSTTSGTNCQEIWVYGMRNPWRFAFDRANPNTMWVADVGQGSIEEVDMIATGGGNYGWRVYEGNNCTGLDPQLCSGGANPITQVPPVFQYSHTGGRCSITGGYIYRGTRGSLPAGSYVYGDYCSGEILTWNGTAQQLLIDTPRLITSFGEDEAGEIYVCYSNGRVDKIVRADASADFDGDLKTDVSVFRASDSTWYIRNSGSGNFTARAFGVSGDIPVAEDYDGDRVSDIAVFRPSTGNWYYLRSSDNTFTVRSFGQNGDVPVPADYDGDAKSDLMVYRPSDNSWYLLTTLAPEFTITPWGTTGDVPAAADYDGDGKADIAVWRPSNGTWYIWQSSSGLFSGVQFGQNGDVPAPGDFDGDGRGDLALFRESSGQWFVKRSSDNTFYSRTWGTTGDTPAVGDYDGDGIDDIALFRNSSGQWFVIASSNSSIMNIPTWGQTGDIPLPSTDRP